MPDYPVAGDVKQLGIEGRLYNIKDEKARNFIEEGEPVDGYRFQHGLLDSIFPIGSVYLTVLNQNPSGILGGTWQRIAEGKALFGVGTGTDSNGNSKTISQGGSNSGEYKHTLTDGEMAIKSHTHSIPTHTHPFKHRHKGYQEEYIVTTVQGGHLHERRLYTGGSGSSLTDDRYVYLQETQGKDEINDREYTSYAFNSAGDRMDNTQANTTATQTGPPTGGSGGTGGGVQAHNVTPPAFGIYVWQRTA